jgi:hypothetical protein
VIGEAEICVFELRGGCPVPLVRMLCVVAIGCGLLLAPRRIVRAWRRARGVRTLYDRVIPYETLLEMTLRDLRTYLQMEGTEDA